VVCQRFDFAGEENALPSLTLDPPSGWEGEDKLMQSNKLKAHFDSHGGNHRWLATNN
jgi:hypothetical protein